MSKTGKRRIVYTGKKNGELGFTYVSVLLAFLFTVMTLPLVSFFLSAFSNDLQTSNDLSVQQFFIFLRNDTLLATHVYVEDNIIYFVLPTGEVATIEQYKDVIRRRVNQKGHEIYVRNIATFATVSYPYGVTVLIETTDGGRYEKTIAFYD